MIRTPMESRSQAARVSFRFPSTLRGNGARIPSTLQAVFLEGNRGQDVHTPPPQQAANRTFLRGWLGRTFSSESKDGKQSKIKSLADNAVTIPLAQPVATPSLSPQQYLDAMIHSRGYSVTTYGTLHSAYHNKPTPLQEASLGVHLIGLVKQRRDADGLRAALAAGLSTNPSNAHGESLVHTICRLGDSALLSVMLEAGCDVQIADDYGRTPLHDACWAPKPAFEVVQMLMERDMCLFYMTDCRGAVPLSYVRKEHWSEWRQFLESNMDAFWPIRDDEQAPPALTREQPHTRPVPEPEHALTVELARMVANGRMTPAEAKFLNYDVPHEDSSNHEDNSESESDSEFSESTDDGSWDEEGMKAILESFALPKIRATLPSK